MLINVETFVSTLSSNVNVVPLKSRSAWRECDWEFYSHMCSSTHMVQMIERELVESRQSPSESALFQSSLSRLQTENTTRE